MTWTPSATDGGAAISSYNIEWDTVAFQEEVQTVTVSSAAVTPTVKVITSSATPSNEVQFVVVQPSTGNVNGTFTLTLRGLTTVPISYAANATVFANALSGLGVGFGVTVVVSGAAGTGLTGKMDFGWAVTFTGASVAGALPALVADSTGLAASNATVVVCTQNNNAVPCSRQLPSVSTPRGNQLSGTFTLSMLGHTTAPLSYAISDTDMKAALELLDNIGTVTVNRTGPTSVKGYSWTITFISNPGNTPPAAGSVANLVPDTTFLGGTGATVVQASTTGGFSALSGTFQLTFGGVATNLLRFDASAADIKSQVRRTTAWRGRGCCNGVHVVACSRGAHAPAPIL